MTAYGRKCLLCYTSADMPVFLDTPALELLAEGRRQFAHYDLDRRSLVPYNADTILFCWRGDAVAHTLAAQLRRLEFDVIEEGHALTVGGKQPRELAAALQRLADQGQEEAKSLLPFCR